MNASQFSVLALAIAAIALVLLVAFCLQSFQYRKRTEQTLETLRQQVASVSAQSKDVGHQVEEQQNRSLVQSKHIQQLQDEITGFNNQIREVKLQDPSMRMYQRAAELVKQGASLEEVMESCDIPRAEAELIVTIHKK
ncbi:DUF2802 domain-containing protein [Salinimonas sp. HHU 13199]|uniref:DUF2802 domain-containing protein n=1 Tax=Salinimonas profundi TaxID=2729140 RepID=A0ABR8LIC3_9ALTE|nr:DUF2802 domain-containing protein [Salinimonas profundi]MBD3585308.1 DUF2802 domain-containing protein [Salinimonas profundi]